MEPVSLRPYQQIAIHDVRKCFGDGLKRVMVYSPTGSGKGEIAVALAQFAQLRNKKCLFLVHRKDLVKQQWQRFNKYGMMPGILQGTNTWKPHSEITVGSIQTFASRKKFGWNFNFDLIIVDEAHLCAGSKHYLDLFKSWNNLPIIGLSATPFSKGLGKQHSWGKLFQHMTVVSTIQKLIDEGFLVDCEIYAPSEPDLRGVKIVAGDYHQKQLGDAVNRVDLVGDIVKNWQKLANDMQTIVFATNINHSMHIVQQFRLAGVNAEHCDCYMNEEDRDDAIDRFKAGRIKVLSNVGLFAEGFDAPATSCMILARPTKSLIRYIQMVGRVLRPAEGKEKALVLDHSGSVARLGFPTDDLPLDLDDGKPKKESQQLKKEKEPKVCPQCKYIDPKRTPVCPKCGYKQERKVTPVEVKEGELQKIVKMDQATKQQIYSGLISIAYHRGYAEGWISHSYKAITGVWPKGLNHTSGPVPEFVHKHVLAKQIRWAKRSAKR